MASEPLAYNNPAGRLHRILKALATANNNAMQMSQFAQNLGVSESWDAVLNAAINMKEEYELLAAIIKDVQAVNPAKHALWDKTLGDIKKSIDGFVFNMPNKGCQLTVVPTAIMALEFIAADLPTEEDPCVDELEQLRKLCDDLRKEIHDAEDLPKVLREWLLDLVRLMRDGIDRYNIRGSRGLRRQLHEMLGSIMDHQDFATETIKKKPTIWLKVMNGLEAVNKIGQYAEKGMKAIGYVHKAIEYFSGTGNPDTGEGAGGPGPE